VDGTGTASAGVDGEAVELRLPLQFSIRPRALLIRIAPS